MECRLARLRELQATEVNLRSLLNVALANLERVTLENANLRQRLEGLTHCNAAWMARALKAEGLSYDHTAKPVRLGRDTASR